MCIKKSFYHFSQNCTCVNRNSQWASRGIFDVITALQQGVWSIMVGISKIRVNNKCWKFWQEDRMYCATRVCKIFNIPLILFMIKSSFMIEILPLYSSLNCF